MRRGLTQEELAGLVGVSLSLMKKIESGQRHVTRFSRILLFAQALRVKDLQELTGVRLTLTPHGKRSHPRAAAVRSALTDHSRPDGERPALDKLSASIERTWQVWQEPSPWRYAQVGQNLPPLLRKVRLAVMSHQGQERRQALREKSTSGTCRSRQNRWIAATKSLLIGSIKADDANVAPRWPRKNDTTPFTCCNLG